MRAVCYRNNRRELTRQLSSRAFSRAPRNGDTRLESFPPSRNRIKYFRAALYTRMLRTEIANLPAATFEYQLVKQLNDAVLAVNARVIFKSAHRLTFARSNLSEIARE